MIPPEFFFLLQHQHHEELMRQAERARLVRASRRKRGFNEQVFQPFLW
jgi:hypothetical protein